MLQPLQLCLILCNQIDCDLPGSSVHGIFPARIMEWVAIPPPEDLSNPGVKPPSPMSPALQVDSLPPSHWGTQGREISAKKSENE